MAWMRKNCVESKALKLSCIDSFSSKTMELRISNLFPNPEFEMSQEI